MTYRSFEKVTDKNSAVTQAFSKKKEFAGYSCGSAIVLTNENKLQDDVSSLLHDLEVDMLEKYIMMTG